MKILGIHCGMYDMAHDTSACLVVDGKLIDKFEEERFTRIKHYTKFPYESIKYILEKNNLKIADIDAIGIPFHEHCESKNIKELLPKLQKLGKIEKLPKLFYGNHHLNHAYESFYQSGFNSAACLVVDGLGDSLDSISIFKIENDKFQLLKKYNILQSLGLLYSNASGYCGMAEYSEGKLMGLASFGKSSSNHLIEFKDNDIIFTDKKLQNYSKTFLSVLNSYEKEEYNKIIDSTINVFFKRVNEWWKQKIYPYAGYDDYPMNIMYYADLAASVQNDFNNIMLNLVKYTKELTNEDNLVLSGGCIQNCTANNLIVESQIFKNVYASSIPHDGGISIGNAFYAASQMGEKIHKTRIKNSYSGKIYSDKEIKDVIFDEKHSVNDYKIDNIIQRLENHNIIAWFQDGSEMGPRALGHRSILANPSRRETLLIINEQIKNREIWRPFAPIVPAELFDLLFDVKSYDLTDFMLRTIPIKEEWRHKIPAVCHIDGTTRPQRLEKEQNPELYELLIRFYEKTGIPCLLNTSFNGKAEPIIETPQEAINFFKLKNKLDYIIFNCKYVVTRK